MRSGRGSGEDGREGEREGGRDMGEEGRRERGNREGIQQNLLSLRLLTFINIDYKITTGIIR